MFRFFLRNCRYGVSSSFPHDPRTRIVNDQEPRVIYGLPRNIVSLKTLHGTARLLKCTSIDIVLGFFGVRQMMAIEWSAFEGAS